MGGTAGGVARATIGGGSTEVGLGGIGLGTAFDSVVILGGGGTTGLRTFGAERLGCAVVFIVGPAFVILRADSTGAGGLSAPMAGLRIAEPLDFGTRGFAMEGAAGTGGRLMAAMPGVGGVCTAACGVLVPLCLMKPFGSVRRDRGGLVGGGSNTP